MISQPFRILAAVTALTLAMAGLTSTLAAAEDDAYPKKNPMAGDQEAVKIGQKLYFKWCVACHGRYADGVSRFGDYGADLRKFWRGYPEFVRIVLNGRTDKQMPPWGGVLDEDEISQIGAYLETLQLEGARWEAY